MVTSAQIAHITRIALKDVRDWLETPEGEGYANVVRITEWLSGSITAKGRLPPNHSAEELASFLDARLPGVLRLVRAEQARREFAEKQAQEFIDNLERLHAQVVGKRRARNVVSAHELIGDLRDTVTDFLNDPLNPVVRRFRYIDTPERGHDPEYDSLVDERRRNYETVQDLYPGKELAEEIRQQSGGGSLSTDGTSWPWRSSG